MDSIELGSDELPFQPPSTSDAIKRDYLNAQLENELVIILFGAKDMQYLYFDLDDLVLA
jgi:hypothetical protein